MTAISLYISTCKYVMQADASDHETWSELYRLLPFLRQALSCCVCGNIISKPRGPSHSECLHNVCSRCVGGKMRLKPSCSWCKDYADFCDNTHLRILVLCFQKLCEYIHSTQIWSELALSSPNGETNPLIAIISEAMAFEDDYVTISYIPTLPIAMPVLTPATVKPGRKGRGSYREQTADDISEGSSQEPPTLSPELETNPFDKEGAKGRNDMNTGSTNEDKYGNSDVERKSVMSGDRCPTQLHDTSQTKILDSSRNRHGSGRTSKIDKQQQEIHAGEVTSKLWRYQRSHNPPFEPPSKRTRAASLPSSSELSRKVCRCARNNPPNRLTCLGQRCPCYSSRMPCVGCMCRGCRNPRKFEEVEFSLELESGRSDVEQSNYIEDV